MIKCNKKNDEIVFKSNFTLCQDHTTIFAYQCLCVRFGLFSNILEHAFHCNFLWFWIILVDENVSKNHYDFAFFHTRSHFSFRINWLFFMHIYQIKTNLGVIGCGKMWNLIQHLYCDWNRSIVKLKWFWHVIRFWQYGVK